MPHSIHPTPALYAIYAMWALWLLSWFVAAFFAGRTVKRSPWIALPVIAAAAAFFVFRHRFGAAELTPLWHVPEPARWALAALVLSGFAFAWWARITLGRLWSGTITLKENHRVVDTGPYALVRHPIYTGLLLSFLASVAAQASPEGLFVAAVVIIAVVVKALAEERFLARELGEEAYAGYRARVPMLIPFGPKSG